MTTKKELVYEKTQNINQWNKELQELEEQHKAFREEDKKSDKLNYQIEEVDRQQEELNNKCYEGNWEERDNWYHGRIPDQIKSRFSMYDDYQIKEALTEISKEKAEKIEKSQEYIDLRNKEKALYKEFNSVKCKDHIKLEEEIKKIEDDISWSKSFLSRLENRGEFITICKDLKDRERRENKEKIHRQNVDYIKNKIIKVK